jgi:hypothetical protein
MALLVLTLAAQDEKGLACKTACCTCDSPSPRKWFENDELWKRHNLCWGPIARFECKVEPRGTRPAGPGIGTPSTDLPVLKEALAAASKERRLVLFIGMTGG